MKLTKNCIACGKKFTKPVNESLRNWNGRHKFCSKDCSNRWWKGKKRSPKTQFGNRKYTPWLKGTKGIAKSNSGSFKKGNVPWMTGKKMTKEHYQKLKKAGFFKPKFGEKSGNWKGGITKIGIQIRTSSEYKKWRTSVFKRDKYSCCKCKYEGNKLQVHHKKPFYKILDDNKITTIEQARKCKELWKKSNGETLCIPCHKQTDSYLINQHTIY